MSKGKVIVHTEAAPRQDSGFLGTTTYSHEGKAVADDGTWSKGTGGSEAEAKADAVSRVQSGKVKH